MKETMGERLRRLRGELSMDKLCDELHKMDPTIQLAKGVMSKWENDKAIPTSFYLTAYARYFNVDMNYVVGLTDKRRPLVSKSKDEEKKVPYYEELISAVTDYYNDNTVTDKSKEQLHRTLFSIYYAMKDRK